MTVRWLTSQDQEALISLAGESFWKRRGFFVRPADMGRPRDIDNSFTACLMARLRRRQLVSICSRINPRRIEAKLTTRGRAIAAELLAAEADELAEVMAA